jgi:hypothetical protein
MSDAAPEIIFHRYFPRLPDYLRQVGYPSTRSVLQRDPH